jgi:hypothetical protein
MSILLISSQLRQKYVQRTGSVIYLPQVSASCGPQKQGQDRDKGVENSADGSRRSSSAVQGTHPVKNRIPSVYYQKQTQ